MKNRHIRAAAMALAALACAVLPSCRPTPDRPIVNSGDDSALNDKIEATAIPTPEAEDENLASVYGFPAHYNDEFICVDSSVKVNADISVTVPNVKAVPVFETRPTTFSPEFVKNFTEKMHPGVTFYHQEDIMTRDEVMKSYKSYKDWLNVSSYDEFREKYIAECGDTGDDVIQYFYEQCQFCLEEYEKLLDTAPETCEPKPFDFEYHDLLGYYGYIDPETLFQFKYFGDTVDDINTGRKFMIMDGMDGDVPVHIDVMSRFDSDVTAELTYSAGGSDGPAVPLTIGRDDVIAMGLDTLKKLGVEDDFILTSFNFYYGPNLLIKPYDRYNTPYQAVLIYHRSCNGMPATDVSIQNDYDFVNGNEYIKIEIMNDRVESIEYKCPYEVVEVENSNVELLSFEDAYDAFRRQMTVEYTKSSLSFLTTFKDNVEVPVDDGIHGAVVAIDKAELVMVRIPTSGGGYRYVPAWQFSGNRELDVEPALAYHYPFFEDIIFMTVNAVDGSRIAGSQTGDTALPDSAIIVD